MEFAVVQETHAISIERFATIYAEFHNFYAQLLYNSTHDAHIRKKCFSSSVEKFGAVFI